MQKAHVRLENEIACISLNPTSNQPVSHPEPASAAMECDEGSKLDSLVAVGMWTDMTVSPAMYQLVTVSWRLPMGTTKNTPLVRKGHFHLAVRFVQVPLVIAAFPSRRTSFGKADGLGCCGAVLFQVRLLTLPDLQGVSSQPLGGDTQVSGQFCHKIIRNVK